MGYQRDTYRSGVFGGTAISLSDMLGNHTLLFSGAVNGRLSEAQVLGAYINQTHRLNWLTGISQEPLYFYAPSTISAAPTSPGSPDSVFALTTRLERFVIRDAFAEAFYPFSRFNRVEVALHGVSISNSILELSDYYDQSRVYITSSLNTVNLATIGYVQPSMALVHDNALFGYVGPFSGGRSRFEIAPTLGSWRFTAGLADYRRYLFARPFTLAVRGLFFGRFGRDADLFPIFLGRNELIRGYTAGSFRSTECVANITTASQTGCAELDQLIGSRIAVGNVELRFPLTRSLVLGFLPVGFPPIEGALFYDVGMAWYGTSTLVWNRSATQSPDQFRTPLKSYGGSIRANLLGFVILRFDYTKPVNRQHKPYWTVSLGPTF
ncbi:MAG: hypothetical protein AUH42_02100 [Gemmatimonadetes bacterium 13_1_40CM_70_11]|nr:MAG: hypothetical protein AUH42_02100 [Gemmatimonadetes bacterium 13_1_40CM_70_11]